MFSLSNVSAAVSNGRIFSVTFVKADGTIRKMVCRTGVRKGVKGKGMSWNPADRGMMVVWDVQAREFRMLTVDRIVEMRVQGQTYRASESVAVAA